MSNPLRHLALAVSFLTIVPLPVHRVTPEDIRRSSVFFPLTGWLIGGIMAAGAVMMVEAGMDSLLAAALLIAFEAWFTRGLHLDGVADLCDGLGGGHEPQRRLAIMKDSATGAFGVVGLVLTLTVKTAAAAVLLEQHLFLFIAFVPAAARWAIVVLSWISTYPRERGTGHSFVGRIRGREALLGFFWLPAVLVVLECCRLAGRFSCDPARVLAVLFLTLLPVFYLRIRGHRLLGGVTGDLLGASCEFGEALGFAAASFLFM